MKRIIATRRQYHIRKRWLAFNPSERIRDRFRNADLAEYVYETAEERERFYRTVKASNLWTKRGSFKAFLRTMFPNLQVNVHPDVWIDRSRNWFSLDGMPVEPSPKDAWKSKMGVDDEADLDLESDDEDDKKMRKARVRRRNVSASWVHQNIHSPRHNKKRKLREGDL